MENNLITLTIDGQEVKVEKGTTILQAAKQAGIDIPTLCFLKEINEVGDCRMCIVEVEGRRGFATSCIQKVEEGMVIHTHTQNVLEARHVILDLIIVVFLIYQLIKIVKDSRAWQLIKGITFLIIARWLSDILNLTILNYLLSGIMNWGVILLIIIFQPEIRRALEQLGTNKFTKFFGIDNKDIITRTK